ncbi:hypothetical protein LLJ53_11070 [Pseudomonas aeruginosa]|uniref:hypothetical protein n=1 Tax=Pseudomonas aeruginosa TaxID=287 RepID=UPI0021E3D5AF|nr:hypothetical protein [Pseudomonas aeruginosa]UYF86545.1 hypothetical protein LLJ53_11070 [Pseudomonas aeruginosa]
MRNEIKAILAATMMITAFSANAGYRMQIPLEIDGGGHLPNRSIVFTGETEIEPVDKAKECDDKASNVPGLLSSAYPDVNYVSHRFTTFKQFIPGLGLVDAEVCEVTIELPYSKGFHCTSNDDYAMAVSGSVQSLGIESISLNYYGECN